MSGCRICGLPEERDGLCPGHREEWIVWASHRPAWQNDAGFDRWIDARVADLQPRRVRLPDADTIHERMVALEKLGDATDEHPDGRPLDDTLALILGLAPGELVGLDRALMAQARRAQILCRQHYTPTVAVLPNENQMIVALAQGITFAVAVLQDWIDDAKAAGEASTQAAFWRARAIELGAGENEYKDR